MLGMADACEGFDAGELFLAQIDFGLVPEFNPMSGQRFAEIDAARKLSALTEFLILKYFHDDTRLEWLVQHRQHMQVLLFADSLDLRKNTGVAVAGELNPAAIVRRAKRCEAFGSLAGFDSNVQKDEIRRPPFERVAQRVAVGELLCIDAVALQNQ
jgi:hypothetical protein